MIDDKTSLSQTVTLRRNAWYGDDQEVLSFPAAWNVHLIQARRLPPLDTGQILSALNTPIGTDLLKELSKKSKKPIILIDDLSRPTPIADVLKLVLTELNNAGINNSSIKILIACGTHGGIKVEDIYKKLGKNFPEEIQILTHDCHECGFLGYTTTKTPVQVNRHVLESDLKIGIGGIYPHPIAGFSGGGKLLVLGAGGYDTIRILHDQKKGSHNRNCNIDHEFRREVNEIARMIGYDFSINLVLNADREVAGVYCGDPEKSFNNGVEFYKEHFSIEVPESSDIVISDMYPFDTDFQYAFDRGLWPLLRNGKKTMRIILVSSPQGISDHVLFPVKNPLFTRLVRRMRNFHFCDITQLKQWISSIVDILIRRSLEYFVVSQSINQHDLLHVLPGGIQVDTWTEMEKLISNRFGSDSIKNVAIYKTAPLLLVHK